jgi:hypothetical protein
MSKILFFVFLSLLAFDQIYAQVRNVVTLGSSTTVGLNATPSDSSWVNLLKRYLIEEGISDTIYNLGVSGKDCYCAMPSDYDPPENRPVSSPDHNITRALELLEDSGDGIIIVSYASNNYDQYSIAEILFCLQTIFDIATEAGHYCLISSTQPRSDDTFESSEMKRKLSILKDSIINRFGSNSLNFYDGLADPSDSTILDKYSSGDEIHYNNAGHYELYTRVRTKLLTITSIEKNNNIFSVYPNPVGQKLNVMFPANSKGTVVIMDSAGRIVFRNSWLLKSPGTIDTSALPDGIYTLLFSHERFRRCIRFVKRS